MQIVESDKHNLTGFCCAGEHCQCGASRSDNSQSPPFDPNGEDGKCLKRWELKGPAREDE